MDEESRHRARLVIAAKTSVWQDTRFSRPWDIGHSSLFAFAAGFGTIMASEPLLSWMYAGLGLLDPSPASAWLVAIGGGVLYATMYVAVYLLFLAVPYLQVCIERHLAKQRLPESASGLDDPYYQDSEHTIHRRRIAETFYRHSARQRESIRALVRKYKALHAEAGIMVQEASLVVEEGRFKQWWRERIPPTLDELVDRAFAAPTPGEIESVTLPFRIRASNLLCMFGITGVLAGTMNATFVRSLVAGDLLSGFSKAPRVMDMQLMMLGMGAAVILLVGYLGLRELGFFPLPLFRGECSAEKTRVFHRFRWKTFKPGRDLAILRFTSNQEADIAFLGADGSHATARVGGKYLDHFIACWASPRPAA